MYVLMHVCVYACMCLCMYVLIYVCADAGMCCYMYVLMYIRFDACNMCGRMYVPLLGAGNMAGKARF